VKRGQDKQQHNCAGRRLTRVKTKPMQGSYQLDDGWAGPLDSPSQNMPSQSSPATIFPAKFYTP
jgi:hypothetical protein